MGIAVLVIGAAEHVLVECHVRQHSPRPFVVDSESTFAGSVCRKHAAADFQIARVVESPTKILCEMARSSKYGGNLEHRLATTLLTSSMQLL